MALVALCGMAKATLVTIGNLGNAADTADGDQNTVGIQRYGAVDHYYQISATEVTIAEFQRAAGAGNGDENYWNIGSKTVGPNAPATCVSVYEAMKYCNWLTSGNITNGAYKFSGGAYQSTDRASAITTYRTVYALPTEDEWYKAAYFKPDASGYSLYANGTSNAPVAGIDANYSRSSTWAGGSGTKEQNGTYDMMGNVWEWMETATGVMRGGSINDNAGDLRSSLRYNYSPASQYGNIGFRTVAIGVIPEPATALLFGLGGMGAWLLRRNKLKSKEDMDA